MKIHLQDGTVIEGDWSELSQLFKTPPVQTVEKVIVKGYKHKRTHITCVDCGQIVMANPNSKVCKSCRGRRAMKSRWQKHAEKMVANGSYTKLI